MDPYLRGSVVHDWIEHKALSSDWKSGVEHTAIKLDIRRYDIHHTGHNLWALKDI